MRRWTEDDCARIAELEREIFPDPWKEEMLLSTYRAGNFYGLVEERDGKVVGYIGAAYDLWDAEILLVAVDAEYRRQRIAKDLMLAVIDRFRKLDKENVFLEVRRSNSAAQALYFGLGFESVAVREKYYENTEDALVLKLALKDEK